jgi:hypothetical protein
MFLPVCNQFVISTDNDKRQLETTTDDFLDEKKKEKNRKEKEFPSSLASDHQMKLIERVASICIVKTNSVISQT